MSWKLVSKTYTGPDAGGATQDSSYDLGYIFYEQAKDIIFRVGNTGSSTAAFKVSASGNNQALIDAVEFSQNKRDWDSQVSFSGIQANEISDTVFCRFTVPVDTYVTSGTFLIRIDEL